MGAFAYTFLHFFEPIGRPSFLAVHIGLGKYDSVISIYFNFAWNYETFS